LLTYSSKNTKKRIKDKKQNKKGSSHYTFDTCLKVEVENEGGGILAYFLLLVLCLHFLIKFNLFSYGSPKYGEQDAIFFS